MNLTIIDSVRPGGAAEFGLGESCIRFQFVDAVGGASEGVITLAALQTLTTLRDELLGALMGPQIESETVTRVEVLAPARRLP